MWIITGLGYIAYQIWAFVPDSVLNKFGIHYIPNKYLAIAVPAWVGVSCWFSVMVYIAYSMMHTHSKDSYFTM